VKKKILSFFWLSNEELVNLGDYLTVPILEYFGYEFLDIRRLSEEELARHTHCLSVIGTTIEGGFRKEYLRGKRAIVWGSGTNDLHGLTHEDLREYDFRAVRGPRTRDLFALDPALPLGDPALFLPEFFPVPRVPLSGAPERTNRASAEERRGLVNVPHYLNRGLARIHTAYSGVEMVDMVIRQGEWRPVVRRIATAEFVVTNSLHGAIIAQAYGTPWAFSCAEGEALTSAFKWLDWFEFLGLDLRVVRSPKEGIAWWDRLGQYGKVPSLEPLRETFPHELAIAEEIIS
jgi:hypothetical protein